METLTHKTKSYKPSFFTSANPAFLLIILTLAIICGSFLWAKKLQGNESKTDLAILHLVSDYKPHPANKKAYRKKLVAGFDSAAAKYELDPLLLVAMSYLESSFKSDVIGFKRGAIGLLQVHGVAAKGCELKTVKGQIHCGARWLDKGIKRCGSIEAGLYAYATGKCNGKATRAVRAVNKRVKLWKQLQQL